MKFILVVLLIHLVVEMINNEIEYRKAKGTRP
jgi:hypothetical protein